MDKPYYQLNWRKWIKGNLPKFLQKDVLVSYIEVLITSISNIHADFYQNLISETTYIIRHTGQVVYLEKVLNEKLNVPAYDPNFHETTKVIYIEDGNQVFPTDLYLKQEEKPIYLGSVSIFTRQEILDNYSDFFIVVPLGFTFDINILTSFVNFYKLPGKTWTIKYI